MAYFLRRFTKTRMNPHAFFITGTDTEIGKTTIATALLYKAKQQGLSTLACKPIASGCTFTPVGLRNEDALLLQAQCSLAIRYETVNPYAFEPAIAPHIAAQQAQQTIELDALNHAIQHVLNKQAQLTLIEGAGGWHVPLNSNERLSDVAVKLALPVIVVVGMRLGCINHALLTVESIQRSGLPLAGWVANQLQPQHPTDRESIHYLTEQLPCPLLGVVPFLTPPSAEACASYLSLSFLG